jgi:nucleotide-binding universal stress UspA family protein
MTTNATSATPARIVVGVDGSEPSYEALRWAARLAPTLGATIQALGAWEYPYTDGTLPVPIMDWERLSVDAINQSIRDVFGDTPPAGLVTTVERGHPSRILVDAARGASMLIVGSRGHGGFAGLLLGSVSQYVAEHATCPVLVVHRPARAGA